VKIRSFVISIALAATLVGCSEPKAQSDDVLVQAAIQSVTLVAVDRVVTRDHATPADVQARAARIVQIASALKALGSDKLSTLPLIKAELAPLLDKAGLTQLERAQADILVNALVTVALERTDVSDYVARVSFVLDEVIRAASAYESSTG
jgi:phospholipase/lecithinase/hemolysin